MTYKRQKTPLKSRSCRFTFFPYPSIILYIEIDKEREIVMARIIHQCEFDLQDMEAEGIDFNQALRIIKGFMGTEDTLDALQGFEKRYEKAEIAAYENNEDYSFDREWRYEIYAYNLLVEGFSKLFAPKEVA